MTTWPYPLLRLKQGKEGMLSRRHPWLYSGAVEAPIEATLVRLADHSGSVLGVGVRMPSRTNVMNRFQAVPPMNGAGSKAKWDPYNQCAGPATKWQSSVFQGGGKMHDGIDNDGDGKTDDHGTDGIDGVASWWGTCHAWTPASLLMPEPQHAVTVGGVTFEVADIKALTQNIFDSTSAVLPGGRCNAKEIPPHLPGPPETPGGTPPPVGTPCG